MKFTEPTGGPIRWLFDINVLWMFFCLNYLNYGPERAVRKFSDASALLVAVAMEESGLTVTMVFRALTHVEKE